MATREHPSAPRPRSGAGRSPERSLAVGAVLCGGRSARMGRDKALLEVAGRPLIERAVEALRPLGEVLLCCGPRPRYGDLGLPLALDAVEDGGPLAGLLAGLEAAQARGATWLAALACDMPAADPQVMAALLARARQGDLDACLLEVERGTQPLCAVYRTSCIPPLRAALDRGERRMVAFHGGEVPLAGGGARPLRVGTLHAGEPGAPAGARAAARNLNTPEELAAERGAAAECAP